MSTSKTMLIEKKDTDRFHSLAMEIIMNWDCEIIKSLWCCFLNQAVVCAYKENSSQHQPRAHAFEGSASKAKPQWKGESCNSFYEKSSGHLGTADCSHSISLPLFSPKEPIHPIKSWWNCQSRCPFPEKWII